MISYSFFIGHLNTSGVFQNTLQSVTIKKYTSHPVLFHLFNIHFYCRLSSQKVKNVVGWNKWLMFKCFVFVYGIDGGYKVLEWHSSFCMWLMSIFASSGLKKKKIPMREWMPFWKIIKIIISGGSQITALASVQWNVFVCRLCISP